METMAAAAARLILDSGAVIAWQRQRRPVVRYLTEAMETSVPVVIPAVVLAECVRGGPRDASIHRLLVAAEALRGGPCVVLTADPADLGALIGKRPHVQVVAI